MVECPLAYTVERTGMTVQPTNSSTANGLSRKLQLFTTLIVIYIANLSQRLAVWSTAPLLSSALLASTAQWFAWTGSSLDWHGLALAEAAAAAACW